MTVLVESGDQISVQIKIKKCFKNVVLRTIRKRLPIIGVLQNYSLAFLVQDMIAGITVGLTAIPQGLAYAIIAGLPPEYGLYASLTSGIIYAIFGTCKYVTIGPTSIISTLTAKYVYGYSSDIAVLAAFLTGIVQILLGVFRLGFLVEFISMPVLTGFTTGAALQIATSQLKSFFGMEGETGHNFRQYMYNFFINIKTIKLWDSLLGASTIGILVLLQTLGSGCKRIDDGLIRKIRWFISLARNAVVVIIGMIIVFIIKMTKDTEPVQLIGDITSGLPRLKPPPFSTVVGNETYNFFDMYEVLGPKAIVIPLVAILEIIAIAKAFAIGGRVDATQEMIAIGMCNLFGSFTSSMPITGSICRSAINYSSGVQTQIGGVFTALLIFLTLYLFTSTFYYIPKSTLAGLIIIAMYSMVHIDDINRLLKNSKREFLIFLTTVVVCLCVGLEFGILSGVLMEAAMLLFMVSRPKLEVKRITVNKYELLVIIFKENLVYCSAEHIRREIMKATQESNNYFLVVLNGENILNMDMTVGANLISIVKDLNSLGRQVLLCNFSLDLRAIFHDIDPGVINLFVTDSDLVEIGNWIHGDV